MPTFILSGIEAPPLSLLHRKAQALSLQHSTAPRCLQQRRLGSLSLVLPPGAMKGREGAQTVITVRKRTLLREAADVPESAEAALASSQNDCRAPGAKQAACRESGRSVPVQHTLQTSVLHLPPQPQAAPSWAIRWSLRAHRSPAGRVGCSPAGGNAEPGAAVRAAGGAERLCGLRSFVRTLGTAARPHRPPRQPAATEAPAGPQSSIDVAGRAPGRCR